MIRESGNRFSEKIMLIKMRERQSIQSETIALGAASRAGEARWGGLHANSDRRSGWRHGLPAGVRRIGTNERADERRYVEGQSAGRSQWNDALRLRSRFHRQVELQRPMRGKLAALDCRHRCQGVGKLFVHHQARRPPTMGL